jgi:hypothetical protein
VAGFLKLRRDIHARAFVGLSAGRARKLKSWFLWRHIDKDKCIFLVFPSVKFFKTVISCNLEVRKMCKFWENMCKFYSKNRAFWGLKKHFRTIFFKCYHLKEL